MKVAERLSENGVAVARAERVIGRAVSDWTAVDVAKVTAMAKSVNDGMANWNDVFPPIEDAEAKPAEKKADKLAEFSAKPAAQEAQQEEGADDDDASSEDAVPTD
jgi:hypothetical protein